MIHSIFSSLPSFKCLEFHNGLNIILAQKTSKSSEKQTRNRAGKSSIAEIIHFLMAGTTDKTSIFRDEALNNHYFGMSFDVGANEISIQRKPSDKSNIEILDGNYHHLPRQPQFNRKTGKLIINNSDWGDILGKVLFFLPKKEKKFSPSFRSQFSYFVRRRENGGFQSPSNNNSQQQPYDQQVNLSYLLGLDWTIPQEWQFIREQEKGLRILQNVAKEGTLGEIIKTTSNLRTELLISGQKLKRLRANLSNFKVLPEYRSFEEEANSLTKYIIEKSNENSLDRQLISTLQDSLDQEKAPTEKQIDIVYKQAGIELPNLALKRFDDLRKFHQSVISNRKSYLEGELNTANQRISERERDITKAEERRSELMKILQTHGAFDHFSQLQSEVTRIELELEHLRRQFDIAEKLETGKTDLDLDRQQLLRRLRQDHREQNETFREAILAFEEISQSLYEEAGQLIIGDSENGPSFEVKIQGQRSGGITTMQIFCFDMMLMRLCLQRGMGPGFIFHDSHLFDGVDERQVAKALQIGSEYANTMGFQYIVTMNDDAIPSNMPNNFDIKEYILKTKLTDAKEDGGLFGIRFG